VIRYDHKKMKTKIDVFTIQPPMLETLESLLDFKDFKSESILYYEGQIPIVAYFVREGQIDLLKNNRKRMSLHRGQVLGLKELVNQQSSGVQATVRPNSIISFIDLTTVKEILKRDASDSIRTALSEVLSSPFVF